MATGTGWLNWEQLLDLNKNQASGMATKVASDVEKRGTDATAAIDGLKTDFGNAVAAGTLQYDDKATADQVKERMAGGYGGPESLDKHASYGDVARKASDAQRRAALSTTAGGVSTLIGEQYAGGYRTGGGNALDAALTGSVGQPRFDQLKSQYGGLLSTLDGVAVEGGKQVDAARIGSREAAKKYQGLHRTLTTAPSAPPPPAAYKPNGGGRPFQPDTGARLRKYYLD